MKKWLASITASALIAGATFTTVAASTVKVQKGDSLWGIANTYGTTVDDLKEKNNLKSALIYPNQILEVDESYIVKPGDTLFMIALEYQVTVQELKEWNNLKSSLIYPGQKLSVEKSAAEADNGKSMETNKTANENVKPQAKEEAFEEELEREAEEVAAEQERQTQEEADRKAEEERLAQEEADRKAEKTEDSNMLTRFEFAL